MQKLNSFKPINILAAISAAVLFGAPALSQSNADEKGFNVAARADRSDRGFKDSRVELTMVLRNAAGAKSTRKLEISTLELPDEAVGDKGLIRFSSPADINGTVLLSHAKILDSDNQWLYLPALKRVKRITSSNKSGPFVGSEFSFEDIAGQELQKYEYTWLREEPCGSFKCDVVERRPLYKNSGYKKQIGWIDQKYFQPRKLEYYDRRGSLLKVQSFEKYKLYNGKFWRPLLIKMINKKTGKSTDLVFGVYSFKLGLADRDFVKGVLQR